MKELEETIGVTAFKGACLHLIDEVAAGHLRRVVLTKRGRRVAAVVSLAEEPMQPLWGALRGTVQIAEGTDLSEGTGEVWAADS